MQLRKEKRRFRLGKRILTSFLAVMLTLGTFTPLAVLTAPEVDAANTAKYKFHEVSDGGNPRSASKMEMTSGSIKGMTGMCIRYNRVSPGSSGKASYTKISNSHDFARVCYWLVNKGWDKNTSTYSGVSYMGHKVQYKFVVMRVLQYARVATNYKQIGKGSTLKAKIQNVKDCFEGYGDSAASVKIYEKLYKQALKEAPAKAPDRFEMYYVDPSGGGQDTAVWKLTPPGTATMKKSGTNSLAMTLSGYNSFAGVEYDLYKADKKTKVGTFTCKKDGTTNTIKDLDPGTYYAKEVKSNDYYKKNTEWIKGEVKSNKSITINDKDEPITGSASIIKKEKNGEKIELDDIFVFHCVNTQNSSIAFDLTVKGNGTSQAQGTKNGILAGKYRVTETKMPTGYKKVTTTGTVTVPPNGTGTITWVNEKPDKNTLSLVKTTDGDGALSGFKFKITGELYNEGTITAAKILETAAPTLTLTNPDAYDDPSAWTVDADDVKALNDAAKARETGEKEVKITSTVKHKDVAGKTPKEIVTAISPVPSEAGNGTIPAGTAIKHDGKVYTALEDVTYEYAFKEETPQQEPADEPQQPDNDQQNGQTPDGEETGEPAADPQQTDDPQPTEPADDPQPTEPADDPQPAEPVQVFDADATEANIVALLSGASFEVLDASDIDAVVKVKVNLKDVKYNAAENKYEASIGNASVKTVSDDDRFTLKYKDFDWNGAATVYKDVNTGNDYTIFVTDKYGIGEDETTGEDHISKGISAGKFTAEEILTPEQAKRYKTPDPQTQENKNKEDITFIFNFENIEKKTPVKLKKTSPDGKVEGISFSLTGKSDLGEDVEKEGSTDANGMIDFGEIFAGKYVLEETSFDADNYVNNHELEGHKNPAVELVVTGEEEDPIEVEFDNEPRTFLYIAKIDGDDGSFLENARFELYEEDELAARFQIVKNDDGSAGINMLWSNGKIKGTMNKTVESDEDITYIDDDALDNTQEIVAGDDAQGGGSGNDEQAEPGSGEQGEEPAGGDDQPVEIDPETLLYARVEGLEVGKHYTLKETKAPAGGYLAAGPADFTFENPTSLIVKNYIPEIGTAAKDSETQSHTACADSEVTIIDTVSYSHLSPGEKYVMKGSLIYRPKSLDNLDTDMEEKEAEEYVTAGGKKVTASKEFVADESGSGTVEMEFTFDGSELAGRGVVVFEKCYGYDAEGKAYLIATHEDPGDEGQTVNFPKIGTTAKDPDSKTGLGTIKEKQTIVDTVSYTNLDPGVTYKMKGTLYDKTTGKFITDAEGNPYKVEKEFTPEKKSGTVDITFEIDSRALQRHEVVAFEECLIIGEPDILVAFHKNPKDKKQTIEYPNPSYDMYKVRVTNAPKKANSDKYGFRIGDTVKYEVHVKNTGNVPISCTVRDEFNGEAVNYFSEPVIEKISNASSSTPAADWKTARITVAVGQTAVVTYTTTVRPAAEEYLAADKKDSDSLDKSGKDTNKVNEANKPDYKDGWTNTAYTDNPTYPNPENPNEPNDVPDGPKNDPAQTPVTKPVVYTMIGEARGHSVTDTVYYENLKPGETYVMRGVLMDKDTEDKVEDSEGYKTFTPDSPNGTVKVVLDTQGKQKELVAFEYCYIVQPGPDGEDSEILIASHEDIDDEDQTIDLTKEPQGKPKTGDGITIFLIGGAFILSTGLYLILRKKETADGEESDIE